MSEFHAEVVRVGPVTKHPNADTLSGMCRIARRRYSYGVGCEWVRTFYSWSEVRRILQFAHTDMQAGPGGAGAQCHVLASMLGLPRDVGAHPSDCGGSSDLVPLFGRCADDIRTETRAVGW